MRHNGADITIATLALFIINKPITNGYILNSYLCYSGILFIDNDQDVPEFPHIIPTSLTLSSLILMDLSSTWS